MDIASLIFFSGFYASIYPFQLYFLANLAIFSSSIFIPTYSVSLKIASHNCVSLEATGKNNDSRNNK